MTPLPHSRAYSKPFLIMWTNKLAGMVICSPSLFCHGCQTPFPSSFVPSPSVQSPFSLISSPDHLSAGCLVSFHFLSFTLCFSLSLSFHLYLPYSFCPSPPSDFLFSIDFTFPFIVFSKQILVRETII